MRFSRTAMSVAIAGAALLQGGMSSPLTKKASPDRPRAHLDDVLKTALTLLRYLASWGHEEVREIRTRDAYCPTLSV